MAQFTSSGRRACRSEPTSPVSTRTPIRHTASEEVRSIVKYCCYLQSGTETHGSGFIVEFKGLRSAKLLALDWKDRKKEGYTLQTNYALITSHDTIPVDKTLSVSGLDKWTVSCQGIENGNEQTLGQLVCGVISCCGHESLFGIPHGDLSVFPEHSNFSCSVDINITILFLNSTFEKTLQGVQEGSRCTVYPPVVSVQKYLNQYDEPNSAHLVHVYYCNGPRSSPKQIPVSVLEQQDIPEHNCPAKISQEISQFRRSQKICYREPNSSESIKPTLVGRCYGSPVVYHTPDTDDHSIIGVHMETKQKGEYVAVTLYGILQILQGLLDLLKRRISI